MAREGRNDAVDIRGSTGLAETMQPSDFRALLDRFYAVASDVLVRHEGVVDKFVGDEVVGIFIPALTGVNRLPPPRRYSPSPEAGRSSRRAAIRLKHDLNRGSRGIQGLGY